MRIAGGGLDLGVSEQLSDDRQTFPHGETAGCEGVAQIVDARLSEAGGFPDAAPGPLQVGQVGAWLGADDDEGIIVDAGERMQEDGGRRAEMDHLRSCLAVRQPEFALVEVDVLPPKGLDLAQPASGQQKEAKGGHRIRAFRFRVRKRTAERFDLLQGQEPLALALGIPLDLLAGVGVPVAQAPHFGQAHHLRQDAQGPVGLVGDMGQRAVQFRDIGGGDRPDPLRPEEGVEKQVDGPLVLPLGGRLAADGDMLLQEPGSELLHGRRLAQGVAGERRIIATPLRLAEKGHRLLPGDLRGHGAKLADHDAPGAANAAVLDEEEALAAGHHPDAESRQFGVEGDVVLGPGFECLNGALGKFRHVFPPSPRSNSIRFVAAPWKRQDENRVGL